VAAQEFDAYWREAQGAGAAAIKLIREMAAIGGSPATIAAILNRRGTPGPNGKSWRSSSVSRILLAQPASARAPKRG
jgi:hypothetical protein